ncbi:Amidohydrolase [Desulfonema limicola]|uniref:Dihydroorotase n=1 Tax=Desulfonema limicola TaxID=45656 RepID=A0A975BB26_9BACT|nr:dihydroorotase [Desulfonema limicola]QTA81920.1 Amidohydrolase [Desulfonema limicola]
MGMLIKNGRIVDPGNMDCISDILIENGKIKDIAPGIPETAAEKVIDASGKIIVPGLIDMHVHFREPGQEYKETIESGCQAAARGGFTAVCTMPNTDPVNDNAQVTKFILEKAKQANGVKVYPVAAISRGLEGKTLCEYGELKQAGAIALSDDGRPVISSQLMRRALEYANGFGLPIISHCEDIDLAGNGAMNEGETATRMGLPGIPNAVESIMVIRDIALSELTGIPVHIAHVSTAESVHAIRDAKKRGIPVTAETAPHYFTLTEKAVENYNTNAKMNPPLRTEQDRQAVRNGLADGTIDVIATDHAPHHVLEKEVEFDKAANGIVGLETSLPLGLKLVEEGVLTMAGLIEKMSINPARILGLERGIKVGNAADITVIDPDAVWTVNKDEFLSVSRNTPFHGWEVRGKAVLMIVDGSSHEC